MQELEFEKIQNFTPRFTIILSRYLHFQCQLPQSPWSLGQKGCKEEKHCLYWILGSCPIVRGMFEVSQSNSSQVYNSIVRLRILDAGLPLLYTTF